MVFKSRIRRIPRFHRTSGIQWIFLFKAMLLVLAVNLNT